MKTLNRASRPAVKILSITAQIEQAAWEAELAARKAAHPLPVQPAWVAKAARWSA